MLLWQEKGYNGTLWLITAAQQDGKPCIKLLTCKCLLLRMDYMTMTCKSRASFFRIGLKFLPWKFTS